MRLAPCRRSGYTLVEISIVLVIFAVVATAVVSQLMITRHSARSTTQQLVARKEGYVSLERLVILLREARLVSIDETGQIMDIRAPNGVIARAFFDPGADNDPYSIEDNRLLLIPDLDEPERVRELAGRATLVGGAPVFQRIQNKIIIRLRLGDAFDNPVTDRLTGLGHQGYQIETTVFLRNA